MRWNWSGRESFGTRIFLARGLWLGVMHFVVTNTIVCPTVVGSVVGVSSSVGRILEFVLDVILVSFMVM